MTRSELIAALEKATEPSRGIDCKIYLAVVGLAQYEQLVWHGANPVIRYNPGPPDVAFHGIPRYTASIDAALTLVPEGMEWVVFGAGGADVWHVGNDATLHRIDETYASTPAIALCIAALKAMEATDDGR